MLKMNDNTYYANVGLLECKKCGSEAIISIERAEKTNAKFPYCPYCGSQYTHITAKTTDETRDHYHLGPFTLYESIKNKE